MNIFEQFGIKEVADVTLYSIQKKPNGELYYIPTLYFDTLKISSTEKTAEILWAEGGLGNSRLVAWDSNKQINISLEDALCTPASLDLCWGGVLSANWKDDNVEINTSSKENPCNSIVRTEKCYYPKPNINKQSIVNLLPIDEKDVDNHLELNKKSSILDNMIIKGFGGVNKRIYEWKMNIQSSNKSISVVPNKFYDITGQSFEIDQTFKVSSVTLPTYSNQRDAVIYKIKHNSKLTRNIGLKEKNIPSNDNIVNTENNLSYSSKIYYEFQNIFKNTQKVRKKNRVCNCDYLAIIVDNDNNYHALIGMELNNEIIWYDSVIPIDVNQFKQIDMWIQFQDLNTLIYFLITKYKDNIIFINEENNSLWCYINPSTMQPFEDSYWFSQGESYLKNVLTLSTKQRKLKAKTIIVKADRFPGMYMFVGETFIKNRSSGENERMQLKVPFCKIKSDNNIILEAGGDPAVFNLEMEVASSKGNVMMELIPYETQDLLEKGSDGFYYPVDGSTKILSE